MGRSLELIRRRITLEGVVQGVGMRPHITALAARHQVSGFVGNNSHEVFVEVQGDEVGVDKLCAALRTDLPPLARVLRMSVEEVAVCPEERGFAIVESHAAPGQRTLIPPDVATCPDCLREMSTPGNRRYRYPFTTCTNCGPRLSIIADLPYDRPNTSMRDFPMCPECAAEYADPHDRRYHAQPISCPNCGPTLWLEPGGAPAPFSSADFEATIAQVHALWDAGKVVAVRGIGGFHLTCDARNTEAVRTLRERKQRPDKPLAVMVPDVDSAEGLCDLSAEERALLTSPARPIVTATFRQHPSAQQLSPLIAPGLSRLGVMLPYSPLHQLLVDRPIVATSGNPSGEPLCFSNEAAREQLAHLTDAFLFHDRDILVPVEDSVFVSTTLVRRSRGLAPTPLPIEDGPCVLAAGGELKNTFTLAVGGFAHLSAHVGDMGSWAAQRNFSRAVAQMSGIQDAEPQTVVCDLHPGYQTTSWAERYSDEQDIPLLQVQHHHAHALSLLGEHGLIGRPAVVATLDGTGYGTDGSIWGGEVLAISPDGSFQRAFHLPHFPLVGGDQAVRFPWRIALGVQHAWGLDIPVVAAPGEERALVESQLEAGIGTVACSSLGRLFDAASALLGLTLATSYEGHAAVLLEEAALSSGADSAYWLQRSAKEFGDGPAKERLRALMQLVGVRAPHAARLFHAEVARIFAEQLCAARTPDAAVGLSGGCAVNRLLSADLEEALRERDVPLLLHQQVPATDGGLSFGQAIAGRLALKN